MIRRTLRRLARSGPIEPGSAEGWAASPRGDWDVRSLLLPLAGEEGPGLLAVRLSLGRPGIRGLADQPPRACPRDEGRLTVLGWGRWGEIQEEVSFSPRLVDGSSEPSVHLEGPVGIRLGGVWPSYRGELRIEAADLELRLDLSCTPPLQWWARAGSLVRASWAAARAAGEVLRGGETEEIRSPVLLGWSRGRDLRRRSREGLLPCTELRVERGYVPGVGLFALARARWGRFLLHEGGGLVDPSGSFRPLDEWVSGDAAWAPRRDRSLGESHLPLRWSASARGGAARLAYQAEGMGGSVCPSGQLLQTGGVIRASLGIRGQEPLEGEGVVLVERMTDARKRRRYGI